MLIRACIFLLFGLLVSIPGCRSKPGGSTQPPASTQSTGTSNTQGEQQNLNAATGQANAKIDACTLITKSEIEAVQGEAVKETKSTDRSNAPFTISQCFYSLPTYSKSVSLQVTRSQNGMKEFWEKSFHKKEGADKEGEERGRGGEEEEEGVRPEPVSGVGEEAFWASSRVSGALYVLKNDTLIRVSLGGSDSESIKIEKSKTLAKKALSRL
jgi:hypothetical protein